MSVDVVIVNYRSASDVGHCLASLGDWDLGTIWLIDNSELASEAAALAALADTHRAVRLIVAPRNLGFGAACNEAYRRSTSPQLLLLNPDALIVRRDVQLLADALAADRRLGAVSPLTYWNAERSFVLPQPTRQGPLNSTAPIWLSRSRRLAACAARRQLSIERQHAVQRKLRPVRSLAGAVLMLRRDAVQAAGGLFDPRFFMFFEDADLSRRMIHADWSLALVQEASAVHVYRHRASKLPLMERSCQAYFRKNHPVFYRASQGLKRVSALTGEGCAARWFGVPDAPFAQASEFNEACGEGVIAFSPSPWMWPAIFRPPQLVARGFDAAEWELLEPGGYAACLGSDPQSPDTRWVWFEKAATPAAG